MKTLKRHTYAPKSLASLDFCLSENPLGPSPKVIQALIQACPKTNAYPYDEEALIDLIARHHDISADTILLGAGANQLLAEWLTIYAGGKHIVAPEATFPESIAHMSTIQGSVTKVPLTKNFTLNLEALLKEVTSKTAFIHLCNPNNPTGIWTEPKDLIQLADKSKVPLLISEAGADFIQKTMICRDMSKNLIIVRSFSKAYGLAGLRIGYSVGPVGMIAWMKYHLNSFRLNSLAIRAAMAALQDENHLKKSITYILAEKKWLIQQMGALGFEVVPSQGQTFIAKVPTCFRDADHFLTYLQKFNTRVVNCSLYPNLERYVRISPQTKKNNIKLINILKKIKDETNEYHYT